MEKCETTPKLKHIPITLKLRGLGILEIYACNNNCTIVFLDQEEILISDLHDYEDFSKKLESELLLTPMNSYGIESILAFFDRDVFEKMRISE